MTDARYPERWLSDRRILRLSDAAHRLFVTALVWSVSNRTDGLLTSEDLDLMLVVRPATPGEAAELVDAGLWEYADNGWRMVDYLNTQTDRDTLDALEVRRRSDRDRQAARRRQRASVPESPPESRDQSRDADAVTVSRDITNLTGLSRDDPCNASSVTQRLGQVSFNRTLEIKDPSTSYSADARGVVAEWLDRCAERPPKAVVGQVAKTVKAMLDEGITVEHVRQALPLWMTKGLHPSALPSIVNSVMNGNGGKYVSPTDRNIMELMTRPPVLRGIAGGADNADG